MVKCLIFFLFFNKRFVRICHFAKLTRNYTHHKTSLKHSISEFFNKMKTKLNTCNMLYNQTNCQLFLGRGVSIRCTEGVAIFYNRYYLTSLTLALKQETVIFHQSQNVFPAIRLSPKISKW